MRSFVTSLALYPFFIIGLTRRHVLKQYAQSSLVSDVWKSQVCFVWKQCLSVFEQAKQDALSGRAQLLCGVFAHTCCALAA